MSKLHIQNRFLSGTLNISTLDCMFRNFYIAHSYHQSPFGQPWVDYTFGHETTWLYANALKKIQASQIAPSQLNLKLGEIGTIHLANLTALVTTLWLDTNCVSIDRCNCHFNGWFLHWGPIHCEKVFARS